MKVKLDSQDKSYVSRVKSRVENHNRQTFDVTELNGQTVMLGSEGIVGLALALRDTMTVAQLLKMISDEPQPYNNKYVEVNPFPRFSKLKKKFKSRNWQYTDSRSTLMDIMANLGYGKSNTNKLEYGKGPQPEGWPREGLSWIQFGKKEH